MSVVWETRNEYRIFVITLTSW